MGAPKSRRPEAIEASVAPSAKDQEGFWFGISKHRKPIQREMKSKGLVNKYWAIFNNGDTEDIDQMGLGLRFISIQFRL